MAGILFMYASDFLKIQPSGALDSCAAIAV